jgi:hypothetical protein
MESTYGVDKCLDYPDPLAQLQLLLAILSPPGAIELVDIALASRASLAVNSQSTIFRGIANILLRIYSRQNGPLEFIWDDK